MKKTVQNLLLLFCSLFVIFIVAEVFCHFLVRPPAQVVSKEFLSPPKINGTSLQTINVSRMPDATYQYTEDGGVRLTPNAHIVIKHYDFDKDVIVDTNSLGFRGPEIPAEKGKEFRILILGDSITASDYLDFDVMWTTRLEKMLKEINPHIRVINAGIGSADIHNELKILEEVAPKLKPDLVLVASYLNDGELSANFIVKPLPSLLSKSYFLNFLSRKFHIVLYRLKHHKDLAGSNSAWKESFLRGRHLKIGDWKNDPEAFDYLILKNARDWGAAWDPKTWDKIGGHLEKITLLSQQHSFKLATFLFPVRFQVESIFLNNEPQKQYLSLIKKLNIPGFDVLPSLRKIRESNAQIKVYYDQCHFTPEGSEFFSKVIFDYVKLFVSD